MNIKKKIACYITAGGKAKRMNGRIKAFININGERIIDRNLREVKPLFSEIGIITNKTIEFEEYKNQGLIIISDNYIDIGPLAGIQAALSKTKSNYVFIMASDMPFIKSDLIKLLTNSIANNDYDAVLLKHDNNIEPLFAIYNSSILDKLNLFINKGESYAIYDFLTNINAKYIDVVDIEQFKNINYESDIHKKA